MSTDREAILLYCCMINSDKVEQAVQALNEDLRDLAWETVNDITVVCDPDAYTPQPYYLGHVVAAGYEGGDQPINVPELIQTLGNLTQLRVDVLNSIEVDKQKHPAPAFHAFLDWLWVQAASVRWELRNIPSWG